MLRFTNLRKITKLLFEKPIANFNIAEPKHLVYPWEGIKDNNDKYQKTTYVAPLKGRFKKKKEKQEFNKLKKMITDKMEREMRGETEDKVEIKDEDVLFKEEEMPEPRTYEIVPAKELYYIPRVENVYEYNNRKVAYLTEFQEPFDIHDGALALVLNNIDRQLKEILKAPITSVHDPDFSASDIYRQDELIGRLLTELKELIPKVNHRLLPNICMVLGQKLRYKEDVAHVWEALEKELLKVIHNFSTIELAKIKFALNGTFPKAGSPKLHKALLDLAIEDLPALNASELMHVFHAFRLLSKDRIYTKIVDQVLAKGSIFIKNEPDTLANLLYTYANCRQKKHQRLMMRDPKEEWREANKLLDFFLDDLENAIPQMSNDALVRLSLSVMLCRTQEYKDVILRIERSIRGRLATLDAFQTANLIYSFSKMNEGLMAGKTTFYSQLEPLVVKHQNQFTGLEMSRIFYAYAARGVLSKDLKDKVFLPWVTKNMDTFNYAELANVAYGLMFTETNDKELWRRFARNVSTQKHRCPLTLYAPIKIAKYYIQMLYPKWDLSYYEDTCFEAERYFNIGRLQKEYNRDEYYTLTKAIKYDINYWEVKMWLEWENLFIVDYAILPNKVGILVKKDRDCLPYSTEARPIFKLRKRILEANGWAVLEVDWEKYLELGGTQRNEWLKTEVDKYVAKTKENIVEDEERRRERIVEALDDNFQGIDLNVGREIKTTLIDKF